MRLFILRHGEAEPRAATDAERNLTARGREEVKRVVTQSLDDLATLQQIWVSPYVRAQQTAAVACEVLQKNLPTTGQLPPAKTFEILTPDGDPDAVIQLITQQLFQKQSIVQHQASQLLLVSHMPLVGELVNGLLGKPPGFYAMATAALACIELEIPVLGGGELIWLR